MDDIYSDLDNYNDVNIVEELKNENKELKFKLEEYSGAMHELQKDFDKLSDEYKKLEKNYSSLLKTARAEIERKTETIKNLNLEKDTLVINSLQKGKNILQHRRGNFKYTQQNKKSTESTNSCLKEVKKEFAERSDNQLDFNRQPIVETVSIPTDCHSAHSENKILKTENKPPKERIDRDARDKADARDKREREIEIQERSSVRKVMDRRKSNFGDCEPTFSSDEDSRKTSSEQQRDLPLAGEDVRHFERNYEQQDYVPPEFDYYQAPQSSYRSRGNRHNDFERQRNYDSYDKSDKSRRYLSPDNHHRYGKELSENYNQRDYKDKRRVDRSPPSDRYNRSKSRDRRHNYERDNNRDYGRHSSHNGENLGAKNKSKFDIEAPSSKRPKVDSHRHSDHNFNKNMERGMLERHTFTKPLEPMEPSSCQSPDHINIDAILHHSIKEIKHTALTPLPDPRLLSNKYFLESKSEKPVLATVAGSNVDILPISNPTWVEGTGKFVTKSQDLGSEVYLDIDNFGKSPSLQSGEVLSLDEDHYATNITNQIEDKVKSHRSQTIPHVSTTKEEEKPFINKYKIPLKKQNITKESNITQEQDVSKKKSHSFVKDFKVIVEGKHLSEKCPETYSNNVTNVNVNNKKPESVLQKLMNEKNLSENAAKYRKSDKIVNISTIEGDLELSDEETSDNFDLVKEDTMKDDKNDQKTKKEEHASSEKLKSRANKSDDKLKKSKETRKSHSKKEDVKEKTRDSSRKRKYKKTDQESSVIKEDVLPQTKRSKEKENKLNSSDQKKNKFTDLFGDSNSLITPDDLGLLNAIPDAIPEKYVPVFENTQDAVDLSVENITKAQKNADEINDEKSKISDTTITDSEHLNSNDNYKSTSTTIYENTVIETNTSNIVKTVIISTGVQPLHISKEEVPSNNNQESDFKKCALNIVKANATSTPYKLITPKEPQITNSTNESINTKENVEKTDLSNINLKTNTSEDKHESDIPDVRIFVRRRKKATKKPT